MKSLRFICTATLCFALACSANERTAKRKSAEFSSKQTTSASAGASGANEVAVTRSRMLLILLDSSKSYNLYGKALDKLIAIVKLLGPGDQLIIAQIGGEFWPESNVRLQTKMTDVPANILVSEKRLQDWKLNQSRLNAIWNQVEQRQKDISAYLTQNLSGGNTAGVSDIFGALNYSSLRLNNSSGSEKYLIIFSDLANDYGKQKSSFPPRQLMEFDGVHTRIMFVPWTTDRAATQQAWGNWFKQSKAADFSMLDASESEMATVLAPSPVPRQLPSPLK